MDLKQYYVDKPLLNRRIKSVLFLILIITVILTFNYFATSENSVVDNRIAAVFTVQSLKDLLQIPPSDPKRCVILYYSDFYSSPWQHGSVLSDNYFYPAKETACTITSKRDFLPKLSDYDALIFFQWNVKENTAFPPQKDRPRNQLYIMHYLESPQRSNPRSRTGPHSHLFNLTMSYRLDSDIPWLYGRVYDKETRTQVAPQTGSYNNEVNWRPVNGKFKPSDNLKQIVSKKKKLISWVVSNCQDDPSERMTLAKSLQKFIPVDIYGKCGLSCGKSCKDDLGKNYFFYLAMENSLAVDYVSEKPFAMMGKWTVPVVYGGADYTKFLPPKSYVNAQDFRSTEELGHFLENLSKNATEYMSYFSWMDQYYVSTGQGYSDLCGKLKAFKRTSGSRAQFYEDLELWENQGTWVNRTIEFS